MDALHKSKPTGLAWREMFGRLHSVLGSDCVDTADVKQILFDYCSDVKDWSQYALFSDKFYTRNLVDDGNGKFNVMVLCWNGGQGSAIHSHAGSHCFMKILEGSLVEQQFTPPDKVKEGQPLEMLRQREARTNEIMYISDQLATHRVMNPSIKHHAISLHIYCPPYQECKCYNEMDSKARSSGTITFYSKSGKICAEDEWKTGLAAPAFSWLCCLQPLSSAAAQTRQRSASESNLAVASALTDCLQGPASDTCLQLPRALLLSMLDAEEDRKDHDGLTRSSSTTALAQSARINAQMCFLSLADVEIW